MSTKSVAEKLGIDEGDRVLLVDAPADYRETLGPLPGGVELDERPDGTYDVVQLFVANADAFEANVETAIEATDGDGRLWITYPKKRSAVDSDLSRDVLAELMDGMDWRGARQIAVDETWSALWFRPRD